MEDRILSAEEKEALELFRAATPEARRLALSVLRLRVRTDEPLVPQILGDQDTHAPRV